jgi:hypothetical protein
MTENTAIELHAADLILKRGVRLELRAPLFLRILRKKTLKLVVTSPLEGTLQRVAKYYLETGITSDQLDNITHEQALGLMAVHGKQLNKAVACAWLNGWFSGWMFTRPLAWYMRWHCKSEDILVIATMILLYGGVSDFMNTTRSVRMMRTTSPRIEGQTRRGS